MIRLAAIALVVLIGAGIALASSDEPRPLGAQARAEPPDAPVRDCRDRITGAWTEVGGVRRPYRFRVRRAHDTAIGPVAFGGMRDAGRPAEWAYYVREDQWLKSLGMVRRGARVTLEVPRGQRSWMRLAYADGGHAVTLAACHGRATRAECGGGDRRTCRSRVTPFSGGFEIDYAEAPRQGRCAELIVWVAGEREPRREHVFGPPGACA